MSQISAQLTAAELGAVLTLTGNTGGAVAPDGSGNINIVGSGAITVTDNPGTNKLTISGTTDSSSFVTNSGTAIPVAGVLNVLDSQGTAIFSGSGNTITHTYEDGSSNLVLGDINVGHSGSFNTGLGAAVFADITLANGNTCIGYGAGHDLTVGSYNTIVGYAPETPTTGSSNIYIGSTVNVGGGNESNTCRIGYQTGSGTAQINATYICGIDGVNVGSVAKVVTEAGNKLGTAVITAGTGVTITPSANVITIATAGSVSNSFVTNSGTAVPVAGVLNVLDSQGTAIFSGSGNTITHTYVDSNTNVILGTTKSAGLTGSFNVGIGSGVFPIATSATSNSAFGNAALSDITSGELNCAFGTNCMTDLATANENCAFGANTLNAIISGSSNCAMGGSALNEITTGVGNSCFGTNAGEHFATSDSYNICVGYNVTGTSGQSNVMRLGATSGTEAISATYISGIAGVNVGSVATVVTESGNQLGTAVITAGTGITITPSANAITISTTTATDTWSIITASQTAAVNQGYFCNASGTLALALPAVSAVGSIIEVTNENNAAGIQFTQAAGQQIFFGTASTTLGATGTLTSTALGDSLKMVCGVANTTWRVISSIGNWTVA